MAAGESMTPPSTPLLGPWKRGGLAAALILGLSACGSGVGALLAPPAAETFDLTAPRNFAHIGAPHGTLLIAESVALQALDTDRILVRPKPNEINYLGGAQWSDRLPRLIQARLLQAFQNAKRLKTVARPGEGIDANLQLLTEIRSFELVIAGAAVARVEITARLVGVRSGRVDAAEIFSADRPASSTDASNAAAALDGALGEVLTRIVEWASRRA